VKGKHRVLYIFGPDVSWNYHDDTMTTNHDVRDMTYKRVVVKSSYCDGTVNMAAKYDNGHDTVHHDTFIVGP